VAEASGMVGAGTQDRVSVLNCDSCFNTAHFFLALKHVLHSEQALQQLPSRYSPWAKQLRTQAGSLHRGWIKAFGVYKTKKNILNIFLLMSQNKLFFFFLVLCCFGLFYDSISLGIFSKCSVQAPGSRNTCSRNYGHCGDCVIVTEMMKALCVLDNICCPEAAPYAAETWAW